MKTIGSAVAGIGAVLVAFLVGLGTAPSRRPAAVPAPTAAGVAASRSRSVPVSSPSLDHRAIPTVQRFSPPPIPTDDPGIAELVNAPDEPPPAVLAQRWDAVDRRLDELFGEAFPAARRAPIRGALTSWIRDHSRAVRAYYGGYLDQAELADHIHANMLAYARSVEATLSRDEYRKFMDLEPGEDPYLTLVPPGKSVGDAVGGDEHAELEK